MKKRIDLHDSEIESVLLTKSTLEIVFKKIVVVNVIDDFGFEFDNTAYVSGSVKIENAKYNSLPSKDKIFDGYLLDGEQRYDLIRLDAKIVGPCALSISQQSGDHLVFGSSISVLVN